MMTHNQGTCAFLGNDLFLLGLKIHLALELLALLHKPLQLHFSLAGSTSSVVPLV